MEKLTIADKTFNSRLFTGTGKFASSQLMEESLVASGSELVTMALKRVNVNDQDDDILKDQHASLAKVFCTLRMRSIVDHARELFGGNGILLQHDIARFVADAEAVYSYEGTKEINSLIVGRAITGHSAFI